MQRVADASKFYTSDWAIKMFDQRLDHIMQHKNDKLGGRKWADLDDVVYAWEPQNEPQGVSPERAVTVSSCVLTFPFCAYSTWPWHLQPGPVTAPSTSSL